LSVDKVISFKDIVISHCYAPINLKDIVISVCYDAINLFNEVNREEECIKRGSFYVKSLFNEVNNVK
jgi:hypothetical protein